jgi:Tol biopolymer transport system component
VVDSSSGNLQTLTKPDGPEVYREFWNNHSWLPEINRIPSSHYLQQAWSTYADKVLMFYEEPVKNNGNIYWIKGICILGLGNYQPRCEPILYSDGRSVYNNVTSFIWSPDDKYIAFLAEKIGRWDIFVYDIEHDRYFLVATDTSVDGLYWGE